MVNIDKDLLDQIDKLEISERIQQWINAVKESRWKLFADRERWTVASWKETEGEDIQIRRAKLLNKILENIEIKIQDFDIIVGRLTPDVIGCATAFDISGDYIPDIWKDTAELNITMDANVGLDAESLEVLRESARLFRGSTAPEMTYKAWESIEGSWVTDAEKARLKDPTLDSGIFPQSTSVLMWEKILRQGIRSIIDDAKKRIDDCAKELETDGQKLVFWESVIIVCEAAIHHSRRYAALAKEMAETETNTD